MEGRNVKIDARWGALDDPEVREQSAKELLALKPDLLLTQNTPPTASMLHLTRTVPVVFVVVTDPIHSRPGRTSGRSRDVRSAPIATETVIR